MSGNGPARPRRRTRTIVALVAVACTAVLWSLRLVYAWADRSIVLLATLTLLALVVMGIDWMISRFGPSLWRLLKSLAVSVAPGLRNDPELRRIRERHPQTTGWLERRLTRSSGRGLYLTLTVLVGGYFFAGFFELVVNVGLARVITHYDPQLYALVRAFRSAALTRVFYAATLVADPAAFVPLVLIVMLLLVMWAKRREALLFAGTVASGYAFGELMKLLLHRTRPDAALALIAQPADSSFPSGHALAAALFAIMVAFIVVRSTPRLRVRLTAIGLAVAGGVLVGLSRVYLGVHWPSDVLGSWLLALGWSSVACGGFLILERYGPPAREWRPWLGQRTRWIITSTVTKAAALLIAGAAIFDPLVAQVAAPLPSAAWTPTTTAAGDPAPTKSDLAKLPLFSEKLDGSQQEPIGIMFIGTEEQLRAAFASAGWSVADAPSLRSLLKVSIAAASNKPYLTAPVTPTFLDGSVQDIAFEKEGPHASARERHHTRFWKTRFTFGGAPVWVATASFDSRLEIAPTIPVPTHHIDPDIDAERDFIVGELTAAGVRHVTDVRVTDPMSGTDAQGDTFFTEGMAALLMPAK